MYNDKNEIFSLYIKFHYYHFFLRQPKTNKILYFCARKKITPIIGYYSTIPNQMEKIAIPFFTIFFVALDKKSCVL